MGGEQMKTARGASLPPPAPRELRAPRPDDYRVMLTAVSSMKKPVASEASSTPLK
jgi:hypothetical protein